MHYDCETSCEPCGFEGPEKRLEIDFKINPNRPLGLRSLSREQINELLDLAKCSIVGSKSNDFFDSYVLSESSLFIYPFKFVIKTCGTTTLLRCISRLMEFAAELELSLELVMYSRKNFVFPQRQLYPHLNWNDEVKYLNSMFEGSSYVFGPLTESHWFLYLADYSDDAKVNEGTKELTLEIMMHDLDRNVASGFYRRDGIADDEKFPGIADLLPGSETDEFNFSPCGYSMNGLLNEAFWTIHVTPEPHCSYASFETNTQLSSYTSLISSVVEFFKPGSFTVYLFSENGQTDLEFIRQRHLDFGISGYALKNKTLSEVDGSCDVTLCNYKLINDIAIPKKAKKQPLVASQLHAMTLEDRE